MYMAFKHLHLTMVAITILLFLIRAVMLLAWPKGLQKKLFKILPHVVDTLLILSAVGLLVAMQMNPLHVGWVLAKIVGLLLYIAFAVYAFKKANSLGEKILGLALAGTALIYIAKVALARSATLGLF